MTDQPSPQAGAASSWAIRLLALVIGLIGLVLFGGGAYLLTLGGTPYFVLMGLASLVSAWWLWRFERRGAWLYGAALVASAAWAVADAGWSFWPLVSRLGVFTGLTMLVALAYPAMARRGGHAPARGTAFGLAGVLCLSVVAMLVRCFTPAAIVEATQAPTDTPLPASAKLDDWRAWANTTMGTRFASQDQITKDNVKNLTVAWTAHTGDIPQSNGFGAEDQETPLQVGDALYLCTPHNQVLALDADTGAERWRFDPKATAPGWQRCRGVAYYEEPAAVLAQQNTEAKCLRRIVLTTVDARLIVLDAATGKPCDSFGDKGTVDLKKDMGQVKPGFYTLTAAPLVARDLVIVGGRVADNVEVNEPGGVVRAYDVHTGELKWAWDPGNPNPGTLPKAGQNYVRATPNVWTSMAFDDKLGLIYLPTGNTTPDAYGGERTELDDKYSSSLVALDVTTGRERWHFQTVHHDLWDYDLPAQPLLYDVPDGKGGTLPAIIEVGKAGQIYMLNRVTGKPIADIVEKPVAQVAGIKGERHSSTQPFSVGLPSIGADTLTEADMWGATPLDQLWCRIRFKQMRYEGAFTPPGEDVSLQWPGSLGGMNWGSVSVDMRTGYMIVNDLRLGLWTKLKRREEVPNAGTGGVEMGFSSQSGTPYVSYRNRFLSPLGIPCQKPPFGTMSAIDLNTRKLVWQVPMGTVKDTGPLGIKMGLDMPIGMPTLGGSLSTTTGLVFFAGTQDYYLRALDNATGKELWRARMPVGSQGSPMSYRSPKTGRQYIVISAGGARQSPDRGDYVIAYALPQ